MIGGFVPPLVWVVYSPLSLPDSKQEFCSLTDVFVGSYMAVPPKTKQKGGELLRD